MEVTYTLTQEDVWQFHQFHTSRKGRWRWVSRVLNGFLVVLWAVQLLLVIHFLIAWRLVFTLGPRAWGLAAGAHSHLLLNFLLFSLFLAYLLWGQKYFIRRQFPAKSLLSLPKRMRIGPQGVDVMTDAERVQRPWRDIPDIASDKERLYLYLTAATALVVPRRAFGSAEEAQAFEAQARAFRADPLINGSRETGAVEAGVWPPPPRPVAFDAPTPAPEPEDAPGSRKVEYVTRKSDIRRSQLFFLWRRPSALVGIFIPYLLGFGLWLFPRLPLGAALLWTALGAFAAMLLTLAWTTQKALNQRFARFANGRTCRTIIGLDGLCDVTPESRSLYRWPEVQAVRVWRGDIYILATNKRGVVIPRTAFSSPQEVQEFVAALERFRQADPASASSQPFIVT